MHSASVFYISVKHDTQQCTSLYLDHQNTEAEQLLCIDANATGPENFQTPNVIMNLAHPTTGMLTSPSLVRDTAVADTHAYLLDKARRTPTVDVNSTQIQCAALTLRACCKNQYRPKAAK